MYILNPNWRRDASASFCEVPCFVLATSGVSEVPVYALPAGVAPLSELAWRPEKLGMVGAMLFNWFPTGPVRSDFLWLCVKVGVLQNLLESK
jgi:hypothetical protein